MQTPPESNYNRPNMGVPGGKYQMDLVIGIIIIILSLCFTAIGGLGMVGGGMIAAGAAPARANGPQITQAAGGVIMVISGLLALFSLIAVAAGIGIIGSKRWGLVTGAVVYGLLAALQLYSIATNPSGAPLGVVFLLVEVGFLVYCVMRLTGKTGPAPL